MRNPVYILTLVVMLLCPPVTAGESPSKSGDDPQEEQFNRSNSEAGSIDSALVRMALVVSDVSRSKRFYRWALGYEVGFEGDITRPSVTAMLGLEAGQTAYFVVLRGASSLDGEPVDSAMIGLLHIADPELPVLQRPENAPMAVGEGMMAIMSSDIQLAYQRMKALGVTILFPPRLSADGSESEMVVYDPDGIRIHVVQRHLEQK